MNMRWRNGLLAAVLAGWTGTARADPAAAALMAQVRQSMPDVPLEMDASLRVVDRTGRPLQTVRAEALLTPREDGRTARYTLFDAFGSPVEEMTVDLAAEGASFTYSKGNPPEPAPTPDLFAPIGETGISWMELSFSFFWWPNPRIVGTEKVANRWDCEIIELDCPVEYRDAGDGWSSIRLWVAPAYGAVVRGEVRRDGAPAKRFEVKSVKKLRKVYMIGDMEVRNLETGTRTRLKVGRMRMLSPDYTPEEMEEFNAPVEW